MWNDNLKEKELENNMACMAKFVCDKYPYHCKSCDNDVPFM